MTHLLDTNVCIAVLRGNPLVTARLRARVPNDCGVSAVSLYELYAGVERCRQPEVERQKIELFCRPLHVLPFDPDAAARAAQVRWHLEQHGELIGPYDLMLAGHALALDITLVTHNTREFQRVPGLMLEDWERA
jgi:tRNA(fMet)-specific endonuclease VapC